MGINMGEQVWEEIWAKNMESGFEDNIRICIVCKYA